MDMRAISGVPGWCIVLAVGSDLYAMVNVRGNHPIVFSRHPATFDKHCGFVYGADNLAEAEIINARERLSALDFSDPAQLLESDAIRLTGIWDPEKTIKQLEELA